ncbi:hypothetical protein C7S14_7439 [Burkholderia cepacia]|nr:hypothetical protein C7S14_7439 [Burkholderia cepacia]
MNRAALKPGLTAGRRRNRGLDATQVGAARRANVCVPGARRGAYRQARAGDGWRSDRVAGSTFGAAEPGTRA